MPNLRNPSFSLPRLLVPLVLALPAGLAHADVYFVDAGAAPGGDGSQAAPFVAIQSAVDAAAVGTAPHLISVAPGSYTGFSTPAGVFDASIRCLQGPSVASLGPVILGGSALHLFGFEIDGQGGVAVQSSGSNIVENCVLRNASIGYATPSGSLWTSTVVDCGIGIQGPNDVTDVILFGNGLDIDSHLTINCANIWQSWQHPVQGLLTQTVDPLFWDLEQNDLRVRSGSPAINAGCWVPDIGAFAFDKNYAPAPTIYCTAKTSSDGCTAQIGWSGEHHASLSAAGDFTIAASSVSPNQNGVLFYSLAPANLPILGGTVCAQPPTARVGGQNSGSSGAACSGAFSFDFNAYVQAGPLAPLAPGSWIYAQYWHRDTAGTFASALSDAIQFALVH